MTRHVRAAGSFGVGQGDASGVAMRVVLVWTASKGGRNCLLARREEANEATSHGWQRHGVLMLRSISFVIGTYQRMTLQPTGHAAGVHAARRHVGPMLLLLLLLLQGKPFRSKRSRCWCCSKRQGVRRYSSVKGRHEPDSFVRLILVAPPYNRLAPARNTRT